MSFTLYHFFLDIENEGSGRLQNSKQLFRERFEPLHVVVRANPAIGIRPLVCVRRRSNNQINTVILKCFKNVKAISKYHLCMKTASWAVCNHYSVCSPTSSVCFIHNEFYISRLANRASTSQRANACVQRGRERQSKDV